MNDTMCTVRSASHIFFIHVYKELSEQYCRHWNEKGQEFVEPGFKVSQIVQGVTYGHLSPFGNHQRKKKLKKLVTHAFNNQKWENKK